MPRGWLGKLFRFGGKSTLTIADTSTATVVSDDDASSRLLIFVGPLTADRTVTIPIDAGADYDVRNSTTGGKNVLIQGPNGGTPFSLGPGVSARIVSDGVVFTGVSAALGGTAGGDLVGTFPNPTVGTITGIAGAILMQPSAVAAFKVLASALTWDKAVSSPLYSHAAQTTDVPTTATTIQSQGPWASATGANRAPGNIVLKLLAPSGGTAYGKIALQANAGAVESFHDNAGFHAPTFISDADATNLGKNSDTATQADVTTTDATVTTLYSFTPQISTALRVYATVIAEKSDGTDDYGVDLVASFRVDGAGAVTVRLPVASANAQTATAAIPQPTIDTSGGLIRVRVTGIAAQTWRWAGAITIVQRSSAV